MAIEFRYLKLIFKSGRSTIGIWEAIAKEVKGHMQFLDKESSMNWNIYINQLLKELGLLFYKQCIWKKHTMIWMNDGTS